MWNSCHQYLIEQWHQMNHSLSFKEQFHDSNVSITEYINEHKDHLILVHYLINCGELKNSDSKYREARSLVIDLNTEEIVLCPFQKFFNINEIEETQLSTVLSHISSASLVEITDKLDGSMQSYRWYKDHLVYSGSTALDINKSFQLQEGLSYFKDNYIQLCKDNEDYTFDAKKFIELSKPSGKKNSDNHTIKNNSLF